MANDATMRQVAALFGRLPPQVARAVPDYLDLFRPQKKGLRWSRAASVLNELVPMVIDGFVRRGRRCKPSVEVWQAGLLEVANRELRRPLTSHGYLLEVVAGLTDKAEAEWEAKRDDNLRSGKPAPDRPVTEPVSELQQLIDATRYRAEVAGWTMPELEAELATIRKAHEG